MEKCEKRLFPIFTILDGLVEDGGDIHTANEAKKLLLLASTPDTDEQQRIVNEYPATSETYSDITTTEEASEIGVMGFWSA